MSHPPSIQFSNTSTLTDICSRADTAEVELVSLLEEHIPHYKLRADSLTQFGGYENEDWYIQTPALSPETDVPLSPEVVEETLKYFVLCADRLSQMTKTYNDIDAVTRLLEEKERDLELAARIGQSLLDQNKDLRVRNDQLEQELGTSTDAVTQLRHDLTVKNGLLQIYTQDLDTDSEAGSPIRDRGLSVNWEVLNQKISCLQEENTLLKTEAMSRVTDLEEEEEKEMQLVTDCVRELTDANKQLNFLQEEVGRKSEDSIRQQEEITQLLSQIVDLQRKLRDVTADNECLASKLEIAEECQHELSLELIDMKEKYGELMAAFQELQAESKQRNAATLPGGLSFEMYCGGNNSFVNPESLAVELENSLMARDSDGYSSDEKPCHSRKIFNTVRYAHHGVPARNSHRFKGSSSHYTMSGGHKTRPNITSTCFSSLSQLSSLSSGFNDLASDSESAYGESYSTDDENPDTYTSGGKPHRKRPSKLDVGFNSVSSGFGTNTDLNTEQDKTESWTSNFRKALYGRTIRKYQFPEKLQIIKPLEGSQTLHHWQRLATPHLGGILEHRPGVKIRGEGNVLEEEEDDVSNPGKSFMGTSSVYTFTTSSFQNVNDTTSVTPSYPSLQLATRVTSHPPSTLSSPQGAKPSLGHSMAGHSLAKILAERGIHAMMPSAIKSSFKFSSPPPTPAPSPEGSPPPSPLPFSGVRIPDLVGSASLAKGFHLLPSRRQQQLQRRSRSQPPLRRSNQQHPSNVGLNLLDMNLEEQGLEGVRLKTLVVTTASGDVLIKRTLSSETLSVASVVETSRSGVSVRMASDAGVKSRMAMAETCTVSATAGTSRMSSDVSSSKKVAATSTPTGTSAVNPSSIKVVTPSAVNEPSFRLHSMGTRKPTVGVTALDKPWGYVPPPTALNMVKSPAALGLTTVLPPLSRMPNPMLQLNNLRGMRPGCPEVGTVGALRTLRKGGYM